MINISNRAVRIRSLLWISAFAFFLLLILWDPWDAGTLEAIFPALLGIFLIAVSLWLWREGIHEALDHRALQKTDPNHREPGAWVAVTGRAVALRDEMKAILSERPALACNYTVLERFTSSSSNEGGSRSAVLKLLYEGFHLVPTGIETETGIIQLSGLPDLHNLEKSKLGHGESAIDTVLVSNPSRQFAARAYLASQVQSHFEVNWKYREATENSSIERNEWILPPGEVVCVFGDWDGTSLIPNKFRPRGLPVYAGTPEEVRVQLGSGSKLWLALGVVPFLAAAWVIFRPLF